MLVDMYLLLLSIAMKRERVQNVPRLFSVYYTWMFMRAPFMIMPDNGSNCRGAFEIGDAAFNFSW